MQASLHGTSQVMNYCRLNLSKDTASHPQEDVLGGVEPCSVDVCRVRRVSLADDAAGEARDGALSKLTVSGALPAGHRVRHHEVDGRLSGTPNLEIHKRRVNEFLVAACVHVCCHLQTYVVVQSQAVTLDQHRT